MPYLFENYALDAARRELRRGDDLVAVEPKVFDLLVHLVAQRDRVVSKDDLIAAVWNGRIVSESALTSAINAARVAVGDSGETQRLIKTLPRKGVRFVGAVVAAPAAAPVVPEAPTEAAPPLPDKPSLAVLPFINMSADPEQEYFSEGIVEEIIAALSRNHLLFVIARNSSFTYKGRAVDVQQVGRDLGVRYVLTGSVRRSTSKVRVAAQLVDAATRTNLWAGGVEVAPDDIFDLQDEVTHSVVSAILSKMEGAEIDRAQRKPTANLSAYDHYLRALAGAHRRTREACTAAIASALKACEIDPGFASAYGLAALCYTQRKSFGWWEDQAHDTAEAVRLARRAADLGRTDALALAWSGQALAFVGNDIATGSALLDAALALNPNLAFACWWRGWTRIWEGDPEAGIEQISRGFRLSPVDPFLPLMRIAMAHGLFFTGRHGDAASLALTALATEPTHHAALRILAAAAAFAGDPDRAGDAMARLLRIDPRLRVSTLHTVLGPYRPDFLAKYEEGLRRAGLPE